MSHFEEIEEIEDTGAGPLDALLRQGLREIPTPVVSPDFDQRILQAVRRQQPWWWIDWRRERGLLLVPAATAGAACLGTLALVLWVGGAGDIRISPSRVLQGTVLTTLQAADSGQVSAATLLLRTSRANAAPPPASPAPPAAQPIVRPIVRPIVPPDVPPDVPSAGDKNKSR